MKLSRLAFHWCAAICLIIPASAQTFPGQYPRIPGSPMPGQYPTGGGQRGPRGQLPPARGPRSTSSSKTSQVDITATLGILRQATPKFVVIEADDHRVIWYRLSAEVNVQKDGQSTELSKFSLGDYLNVDSTATEQGEFTAVAIQWRNAASEKDRLAAAKTFDLPRLPDSAATSPGSVRGDDDRPILRRQGANADPKPEPKAEVKSEPPPQQQVEVDEVPPQSSTIVQPPDAPAEADDPGRPVLKRRTTPVTAAATEAPSAIAIATLNRTPLAVQETAPAPPPKNEPPVIIETPVRQDEFIEKVREATASYTESMPNFFAKQLTTRSRKQSGQRNWETIDVVSADVAYEDGKETYTHIMIGNKPTNKPMEEIGGARSTGEFSSILEDLFDPSTAADFRRSGQATIRNRPAVLYNFEIPRERSHWRINAPSQLYYPPIKGAIWVDKETNRVLRIEMQARSLPSLFPFDTIETAVDYDFIRLGDMGFHLLPIEADALMCQRGTPDCSRNHIEFRNYRKFGSESGISYEEPVN